MEPPDLRSLRSRIPRDLAVICAKCLEKERGRRYASMADLAADLRRYLRGETIVATPNTLWRKASKFTIVWTARRPQKTKSARAK